MSSKAGQIRESLEVWRRSQEVQKEELIRLKSDKNEAKRRFEEISEKLRNLPNINIKRLEEERKDLERDIKKFDERLPKINEEKLKFIAAAAPAILLSGPLTKLSELIKTRDESGKIPPEYQKSFLQRLLRDGECICGTDLTHETENRLQIEKLLNQHDELGELSNLLIRLEGTINRIQSTTRKFNETRIKFNGDRRSLEVQRERASRRIKQISESIGSINKDEILRLEAERQKWFNKLEKLNNEIGKKGLQIGEYQKRIDRLERLLDSELKKDKRSQELVAIRDFCNDALNVAETIREEIMTEIKAEIEEKTEKQFFSLIWKASDYKNVSIEDEYKVSVTHHSGFEGIGTLSAGEGIILALSFMAAINSVSGFDVPIIIDTPLGRIAGVPRDKIARNLPDYLPGKQVTMLVTDTEFTETVQKLLSRRVGKIYRIEFTEMGVGGIAEVIPVE